MRLPLAVAAHLRTQIVDGDEEDVGFRFGGGGRAKRSDRDQARDKREDLHGIPKFQG